LREVLPNHQIINSSISGTCVREHALLFPSRIKKFPPDLFIYQMYVGNDLLEWRHPIQSPDISRLRKMYWWMADRISVLGYINAKMPQIRQKLYNDLPTTIDRKSLEGFSPEKYSSRSKMHFRAEPDLIDQSVLLNGSRKKDLVEVTKAIQGMIKQLPANCKVLILPIPHCAQIGEPYIERLQQIGAVISDQSIAQDNYPFFTYLEEQLTNKRVQVLNPLPQLRQQDSIQAVYYNNDPHLNPIGHQVIRKQIQEKWLKSEGFAPKQ
jgi:hypothetical protein